MNDEVIKIIAGMVAGLVTEILRRRIKKPDDEHGIIAVAKELEECHEQNEIMRELLVKYRENIK